MTEPGNPPARKRNKPGPKGMSFPPETHGIVQGLVLAKWDQDMIAAHLKIDPKTLRKHFRADLGNCPMGPKPMDVTDEMKGQVRGLSMANVPQDQIAKFIGVGEDQLKKYFGDEMAKGRLTLLGGAATNMARMALGSRAEFDGKGNCIRAEVQPQFVACCYVLKSQGKDFGWGERFEHTGKDGQAIPIRLGTLSDAQLVSLLERLEG